MKKLSGGPGTVTGFFLRIGQFSFAFASYAVLFSSPHYANFSAFRHLENILVFQIFWSLGLACIDVYALIRMINIQTTDPGYVLVIGNWVMATLSLSASCSSAGVMGVFVRNMGYCTPLQHFPCSRVQVSIALSFVVWFLNAISYLVSFWIYVSAGRSD